MLFLRLLNLKHCGSRFFAIIFQDWKNTQSKKQKNGNLDINSVLWLKVGFVVINPPKILDNWQIIKLLILDNKC